MSTNKIELSEKTKKELLEKLELIRQAGIAAASDAQNARDMIEQGKYDFVKDWNGLIDSLNLSGEEVTTMTDEIHNLVEAEVGHVLYWGY